MLDFVLLEALGVSLVLNVLLFIRIKRRAKGAAPSLELREFLADVASGAGILQVKRIDPSDLMIKSPKGRI